MRCEWCGKIECDNFDDLPIQYYQRDPTDVLCLIIGVGFNLVMIILALVSFNHNNFSQITFPTDTDGVVCEIQKPGYPYLYFVNPPDIARRVCVAECPKLGSKSLKCVPTHDTGCYFINKQNFPVTYYENEADQTASGKFCFPKNEVIRMKLEENSKMNFRSSYSVSRDSFILCGLVAIVISSVSWLLIQSFPRFTSYIELLLCGMEAFINIVVLFFGNGDYTVLKIFGGIFLLLNLLMMFKKLNFSGIYGIFLEQANLLISDQPKILLFVPMFLIVYNGFVGMIILEFWAFRTVTNTNFDEETSLFYQSSGLTSSAFIFLIIQIISGLFFIQSAFNFCISGMAVNQILRKDENIMQITKTLLKHLGSVFAGSFLTGLLFVPWFIEKLLKLYEPQNNYCCRIISLSRSDVMAYIYLTGTQYFPGSKYCEHLEYQEHLKYLQEEDRRSSKQISITGWFFSFYRHLLVVSMICLLTLYVQAINQIQGTCIIVMQCFLFSALVNNIHVHTTETVHLLFSLNDIKQLQMFQRFRQIKNKIGRQADSRQADCDY